MSKPEPAVPLSAWKHLAAPSLDDFTALAEQAFAALPETFRNSTGEVVFQVADFASQEVLDTVGVEDPFDLTGLYDGAPLSQRSLFDAAARPSMIFLYRRPILDEWAARGNLSLAELVTHVLVHEIGHHFGLTDGDIHAIEDDDED
jgi:predicted Zn-dependent protease with MMP-like domain